MAGHSGAVAGGTLGGVASGGDVVANEGEHLVEVEWLAEDADGENLVPNTAGLAAGAGPGGHGDDGRVRRRTAAIVLGEARLFMVGITKSSGITPGGAEGVRRMLQREDAEDVEAG
jgi:hypothetical protein